MLSAGTRATRMNTPAEREAEDHHREERRQRRRRRCTRWPRSASTPTAGRAAPGPRGTAARRCRRTAPSADDADDGAARREQSRGAPASMPHRSSRKNAWNVVSGTIITPSTASATSSTRARSGSASGAGRSRRTPAASAPRARRGSSRAGLAAHHLADAAGVPVAEAGIAQPDRRRPRRRATRCPCARNTPRHVKSRTDDSTATSSGASSPPAVSNAR